MSKEQKKVEAVKKQPKTVKVRTLVNVFILLVIIAGAFSAGWVAKTGDQNRVNQAASQLVQQLKSHPKQ